MTQETNDVVKLMETARDMLSGHLMGHHANAVGAGIDLIQSQSARIAELRDLMVFVRNELYLNYANKTKHLIARIDLSLTKDSTSG